MGNCPSSTRTSRAPSTRTGSWSACRCLCEGLRETVFNARQTEETWMILNVTIMPTIILPTMITLVLQGSPCGIRSNKWYAKTARRGSRQTLCRGLNGAKKQFLDLLLAYVDRFAAGEVTGKCGRAIECSQLREGINR